jgi:hypothetical protein
VHVSQLVQVSVFCLVLLAVCAFLASSEALEVKMRVSALGGFRATFEDHHRRRSEHLSL